MNRHLKKLYYKLNSGKNSKLAYYAASVMRDITPRWMLRPMLGRKLAKIRDCAERDYILDRVDYYCKMDGGTHYDGKKWLEQSVAIGEQKKIKPSVYYYDSMRYARWFKKSLRWVLKPGDINYNMDIPAIVKSRPIGEGNELSVIMKLDLVRHYIFTNDRKDFTQKKDMAIFRGGITGEQRLKNRKSFVEKFLGNPMFDIGVLDKCFPQWYTEKITIEKHLDYKFIMALEGYDVASNLIWVMSSNSIAVMPRPRCETWFMQGRLIPDYHYIEVKPDFSDIEERLQYYINHADEAQEIIRHAHEWVGQFRNKRREKLIHLLVLDKYFKATNR